MIPVMEKPKDWFSIYGNQDGSLWVFDNIRKCYEACK